MYESFFGLNARPFRLAPDPRFFFQSDIHKKALAHLRYGFQQSEGFVVMTGAPGTGKSTLIYALVDGLPCDTCVAEIVSTRLDADDLLQLIAAAFNLSHRGETKAELLKSLQEFLLTKARKDQRVIIVVDEAHNLPLSALEELRMLTNYCWNRQETLQIFLLGRDALQASLLHPEMLQLRQRIVVRCQLSALGVAETTAYIESRLYQSNWQGQPGFSAAAYAGIHQFTGGIPRNINIFCDRLLLYVYLEQLDVIDMGSVDFVIDELLRETGVMPPVSEVYQSHPHSIGHTVPVLLSVADPDLNTSSGPPLLSHVVDKPNIDKPSTVETLHSAQQPFEINKDRVMTAFQRDHLTNDPVTQKRVLSRSSLASNTSRRLSVPVFESFTQPIPSLRVVIASGVTLSLAIGLVFGLMNDFTPNTLSSDERNRVHRIPLTTANHKPVVAQPLQITQTSTGTANSSPVAMVVNDLTTPSNDKPIASHLPVRYEIAQNANKTMPTILPSMQENFNLGELYTLEAPVIPQAVNLTAQPKQQQVVFTSIESTKPSSKPLPPIKQRTVVNAIKLSAVTAQYLIDDFIFAYRSGDLKQLTLLFADNVKVDKTNSRVALMESYQKLFAVTDRRDMQLHQIHWQIEGHIARAEGLFNVNVYGATAQQVHQYNGRFKLDIEERPQGLVITRLDHTYTQ